MRASAHSRGHRNVSICIDARVTASGFGPVVTRVPD
jgi:hypothetical protein